MEAHPYSVARYRPLVRHNVALAKKYERLALVTKGNKSKKHTNKAKRYRRRAKCIAAKWSAQVRWNQANFYYVLDQMYGPPDPEVRARIMKEMKIEDDARKARSYDFQDCADLREEESADDLREESESGLTPCSQLSV